MSAELFLCQAKLIMKHLSLWLIIVLLCSKHKKRRLIWKETTDGIMNLYNRYNIYEQDKQRRRPKHRIQGELTWRVSEMDMRVCQCKWRQDVHRRERWQRDCRRGEQQAADGGYSQQDSHHVGDCDRRQPTARRWSGGGTQKSVMDSRPLVSPSHPSSRTVVVPWFRSCAALMWWMERKLVIAMSTELLDLMFAFEEP